jgi:hypothetical protein
MRSSKAIATIQNGEVRMRAHAFEWECELGARLAAAGERDSMRVSICSLGKAVQQLGLTSLKALLARNARNSAP